MLAHSVCLKFLQKEIDIVVTRKYPLRGYILGVLTHTTALDRLWGGDKTLKCGIVIRLSESILTW